MNIREEIGRRIPAELRARFPDAEWTSVATSPGWFKCSAIILGRERQAEVRWPSDEVADEDALIAKLALQLAA